jgi:hypothetical protein
MASKKKKKVVTSDTAQQGMYDEKGKKVGIKYRRVPKIVATKV